MERRVLLAVVLSFVVLFGYQALFVKPNSEAAGPGRDHVNRARRHRARGGAERAPGADRPDAGGARRRERRTADRDRNVARQGDVLEPRRHPRELAAQGLSRFQRPADGHGRAGVDDAGSPPAVADGGRRRAQRAPERRALPGVERRPEGRHAHGIAAVHVSRRVGRLGGEDDRGAAGRAAVPAAGQDGSPRRRTAAARDRARRRRVRRHRARRAVHQLAGAGDLPAAAGDPPEGRHQRRHPHSGGEHPEPVGAGGADALRRRRRSVFPRRGAPWRQERAGHLPAADDQDVRKAIATSSTTGSAWPATGR